MPPSTRAASELDATVPVGSDPGVTPPLGLDVTVRASSDPSLPRVSAPPSNPSAFGYEGARIDHFVVRRKLGSGGMGTVYTAHDTSLDRPVALKVLPDELALRVDAQERFIREAQAQARLRVAEVVQIYFIGRVTTPEGERGPLYFAMELVDGESLERLLARGERLDPERARRLMIKAARGLHAAHRAGVVHRDIKPGNLLVDRDGSLKIADFGLAKPDNPKLGITRQGALMGTPLYMAPEQALGDALDHRADMYSLGCTFYHLLTGRPPFDGRSVVTVIAKHIESPPEPLRKLRPELPFLLCAIIERLMAKDRARRYASYGELIDALEAAAPERTEYAGFWTRGAAAALDAGIASVLIALLGAAGLGLYLAYLTLTIATFGQTLAKFALRIRVQREGGARLGLARSLARTAIGLWLPLYVGFVSLWTQGIAAVKGDIGQLAQLEGVKALVFPIIVSNLLLTLLYAAGFVMAAFHRHKQALHDRLVGAHVVYALGPRKWAPLPE